MADGMWVWECVRCKFKRRYKSSSEMKMWKKITVRGNEENKRCEEREKMRKRQKWERKSADWLQKQTNIFIKSGIHEFWFWFIAFQRLTRLPANVLMLPTAAVDRSPKFFYCEAAAFMLALLVGWVRKREEWEKWEGRRGESSRGWRGQTRKRRRGGGRGNKKMRI